MSRAMCAAMLAAAVILAAVSSLVAAIPAAAVPTASEGAAVAAAEEASRPLFSLPPSKAYHFLGGMASGLFAAALITGSQGPQLAPSYPLYLPAVALSTATAAGIGKEMLDSTGFGGAEFSDILITMAGGLAAAGLSAYFETIAPPTSDGGRNTVTLLAASAAILSVPVVIAFIREASRAGRHEVAGGDLLLAGR